MHERRVYPLLPGVSPIQMMSFLDTLTRPRPNPKADARRRRQLIGLSLDHALSCVTGIRTLEHREATLADGREAVRANSAQSEMIARQAADFLRAHKIENVLPHPVNGHVVLFDASTMRFHDLELYNGTISEDELPIWGREALMHGTGGEIVRTGAFEQYVLDWLDQRALFCAEAARPF